MEEQTLTAEVVAVKTKKKDAIGKRRKWRGGERRERREGCNESKREEKFWSNKREEIKYSKKGASRKICPVNIWNALLLCGFLPSFPDIHTKIPFDSVAKFSLFNQFSVLGETPEEFNLKKALFPSDGSFSQSHRLHSAHVSSS